DGPGGAPEGVAAVHDDREFPTEFHLAQNYPTPFNPTTKIKYSLPSVSSNQAKGRVGEGSHVVLKVYDVLAREVATLVNEEKLPGTYSVTWDPSQQVVIASGVYFYRLTVSGFAATRKLILQK
ncbi:MAG: T9SS type A sorting domain-containing protein, partial [Bacteroidota bacterium]